MTRDILAWYNPSFSYPWTIIAKVNGEWMTLVADMMLQEISLCSRNTHLSDALAHKKAWGEPIPADELPTKAQQFLRDTK